MTWPYMEGSEVNTWDGKVDIKVDTFAAPIDPVVKNNAECMLL